jgi:hypothetical protein
VFAIARFGRRAFRPRRGLFLRALRFAFHQARELADVTAGVA